MLLVLCPVLDGRKFTWTWPFSARPAAPRGYEDLLSAIADKSGLPAGDQWFHTSQPVPTVPGILKPSLLDAQKDLCKSLWLLALGSFPGTWMQGPSYQGQPHPCH